MGNKKTKNRKDNTISLEADLGTLNVPENITDRLYNSIARIEYKINEQNNNGTGFFMKIDINKKIYNIFITCYHLIPQELVNEKKIINIFYGKFGKEKKIKIKLDKQNRFIKCFEDLDSTIIEVLEMDNIEEDKYLFPDLNYKSGFDQYLETEIYTAGYPNEKVYRGDKFISAGIIETIKNDDDFLHNCSTKKGCSGSPLIDIKKKVIGIHFGYDKSRKKNLGKFIGKILDRKNLEKIEERKDILNTIKKEKINSSEIIDNSKSNLNNFNLPSENGFSNMILKMCGLEGINPQFLVEMYNSPFFMSMIKNLYSDPNLLSEYKSLPQIKELTEKNPLIKMTLDNPEMVTQSLNQDNIKFISNIFTKEGNNNISENEKKIEEEEPKDENLSTKKESFKKEASSYENDDYEKYREFLIKLGEKGFTDNDLNLELLKDCNGNYEKTLNILKELGK